MGSFGAKVAGAKPSGQGVYCKPGLNGIAEITALKYIETRGKGDAFIVDFNILTSNSTEDKAGSVRNWYVGMDADGMGLGNAQKFFEALFGIDIADMEGATKEDRENAFAVMIDDAMDAKTQPMVGRLVNLITSNIITKGKKEDFTLHTWGNVPEEKQDDVEWIAKIRQEAGFAAF